MTLTNKQIEQAYEYFFVKPMEKGMPHTVALDALLKDVGVEAFWNYLTKNVKEEK